MKRMALMLVVLLVVGCAALAQAQAPDEFSKTGWVVAEQKIVGPLLVSERSAYTFPAIGRGGKVTGFAFAPGRAELAYTAREKGDAGDVFVLRIVQMSKLLPVPRQVMKTMKDAQGKEQQFLTMELNTVPFTSRERELLRLAVPQAGAKSYTALGGPISWAADGTKLFVHARQEGKFAGKPKDELWQVDYATGEKEVVAKSSPAPDWRTSPDGRYTAKVEKSDASSRLQVRERISGAVVLSQPAIAFACWQPSSRLLAYIDPEGTLRIASLENKSRGRSALVDGQPDYDSSLRQAIAQWSVKGPVPPMLRGSSDTEEEVDLSWLVFTIDHKLKPVIIAYLPPNTDEQRATLSGAQKKQLDQRAEMTESLNNMKQVMLGIIMYAADYDGIFPSLDEFALVIQPYIKDGSMLAVPGKPDQQLFNYLVQRRVDSNKLKNPAEVIIGISETSYAGGRLAAYADGHVKWVRKGNQLNEELQKSQEALAEAAVQ